MPIIIPNDLPATEVLKRENMFVMSEGRAGTQDIRTLEILVVNLMPTKIATETQLARMLANSPLQVRLTLLRTESHQSKNTSEKHLETFYKTFEEVKDQRFDGMILTGAPLDFQDFEEVDYWEEITKILDWSEKNIYTNFYLCWGAFAAFYYFYGLMHEFYDEKLSGIYKHRVLKPTSPLFRGFDDEFYAPHSREIYITKEQILSVPELELMAESDEAGVTIVKTVDSRKFFVTCHAEYDSDTLANEYKRDIDKGIAPNIPKNYFPDDDPSKAPVVNWRSTGQLLYTNWLNYYVYQSTPYDVESIGDH